MMFRYCISRREVHATEPLNGEGTASPSSAAGRKLTLLMQPKLRLQELNHTSSSNLQAPEIPEIPNKELLDVSCFVHLCRRGLVVPLRHPATRRTALSASRDGCLLRSTRSKVSSGLAAAWASAAALNFHECQATGVMRPPPKQHLVWHTLPMAPVHHRNSG